jgi:hypothetical protein
MMVQGMRLFDQAVQALLMGMPTESHGDRASRL